MLSPSPIAQKKLNEVLYPGLSEGFAPSPNSRQLAEVKIWQDTLQIQKPVAFDTSTKVT